MIALVDIADIPRRKFIYKS